MSNVPNQTPFPSMIGNNPELSGLMGFNGVPSFSEVFEGVALEASNGDGPHTPQSAYNFLMDLRSQFPFLPIIPPPTSYVSLYATSGSIAEDLVIPDGCVLMMIRGTGDYYMSTSGAAVVPTDANTQGTAGSNRTQVFYAPQGIMFYVGGLKALSIICPVVGTIVTAMFWSPIQLPR